MAEARVEELKVSLGPPEEHHPSRAGAFGAVVLVVLAICVALVPIAPALRAIIATGLLIAAFGMHRLSTRKPRVESGWVKLDRAGIERIDPAGVTRIARWSDPFGATILASHDRTRLVFAFTSPRATRYVGVRLVDTADRTAAASVVARASTIAGSDVMSVRSDEDATLTGADAHRLLTAITDNARAALSRIYLSDARGEPVELDGQKLRVGKCSFDLELPLEWRGLMFQESAGRITGVYQATWIKQADTEAVLVATLPAESSWARDLEAARRAAEGRAIVHDLRLMHSAPDEPPPRELRFAIDRLFMLPLRQALARAPRSPAVHPVRATPIASDTGPS